VDKLEFVLHVKKIPSEEGRSAELALYRRCPDEAEAILLQAKPPLLYRAIKVILPPCARAMSAPFLLAPFLALKALLVRAHR
jgi:hypothetical protein